MSEKDTPQETTEKKVDHLENAKSKLTVDEFMALKNHFKELHEVDLDGIREKEYLTARKEIENSHFLIPCELKFQAFIEKCIDERLSNKDYPESDRNHIYFTMFQSIYPRKK